MILYVSGPIPEERWSSGDDQFAPLHPLQSAYYQLWSMAQSFGDEVLLPRPWASVLRSGESYFEYVHRQIERSDGIIGFVHTGEAGPNVEVGMAAEMRKSIALFGDGREASKFVSSIPTLVGYSSFSSFDRQVAEFYGRLYRPQDSR